MRAHDTSIERGTRTLYILVMQRWISDYEIARSTKEKKTDVRQTHDAKRSRVIMRVIIVRSQCTVSRGLDYTRLDRGWSFRRHTTSRRIIDDVFRGNLELMLDAACTVPRTYRAVYFVCKYFGSSSGGSVRSESVIAGHEIPDVNCLGNPAGSKKPIKLIKFRGKKGITIAPGRRSVRGNAITNCH